MAVTISRTSAMIIANYVIEHLHDVKMRFPEEYKAFIEAERQKAAQAAALTDAKRNKRRKTNEIPGVYENRI